MTANSFPLESSRHRDKNRDRERGIGIEREVAWTANGAWSGPCLIKICVCPLLGGFLKRPRRGLLPGSGVHSRIFYVSCAHFLEVPGKQKVLVFAGREAMCVHVRVCLSVCL